MAPSHKPCETCSDFRPDFTARMVSRDGDPKSVVSGLHRVQPAIVHTRRTCGYVPVPSSDRRKAGTRCSAPFRLTCVALLVMAVGDYPPMAWRYTAELRPASVAREPTGDDSADWSLCASAVWHSRRDPFDRCR